MKRNKKLLPLILLIISAFFLSYTFYESEIKYKGTERSDYFKYYLICFLFVLCSIISFFLKRKTIRNISIIFIIENNETLKFSLIFNPLYRCEKITYLIWI